MRGVNMVFLVIQFTTYDLLVVMYFMLGIPRGEIQDPILRLGG